MQEIRRACRVRRAGALFLTWKLRCIDYGTWAKKEEPLKNGSGTIREGKRTRQMQLSPRICWGGTAALYWTQQGGGAWDGEDTFQGVRGWSGR